MTSDDNDKKQIVFLCTGNSCRSQMAEGFAKQHLGDNYEIHSAGIQPIGIDERAIEVMNEKGIDIRSQTSISLEKTPDHPDLLIILCARAAQRCPTPSPETKTLHWHVEDPYFADGSYYTDPMVLVHNKNAY